MTSPSQVQALVVAYDPGPTLGELCVVLRAAGVRVLVMDNGSTVGADELERCRASGAEVVELGANLGVSGALAAGLARAGDAEWLLTFDQDSVIDAALLAALLGSVAAAAPRVAMIGPHVVDADSGDLLQGSAGASSPSEVPLLITSGALCRVAALHEVAGFREDLFIDHVDHDVCLRLRGAGWRIMIEPAAVMRHSIGRMRTHRVGGVGVRNSHHSPDRHYYKYRNFLLLVRSGTARHDTRWTLRTALSLGWGPLKILAFESEKAAKLVAIAAGIRDGLAGRGGPRRR